MTPVILTLAFVVLLACPAARVVRPQARRAEPVVGITPRRSGQQLPWRRSAVPATPDVIDLLDALAADVRSGTTLRAAFESAGTEPAAGSRVAVARSLRATVEHPATGAAPPPALAIATQAISAALALGGSQARAIDTAATLLRERHAIDLERHAHSAQARLSARVMTMVPVAFTTWVLLTNEAARRAAASPLGAAAIALGACLNAMGWLWMRRIVRVAA